MKINIIKINNTQIVEVISDRILIKTPQDVLDILFEHCYNTSNKIILKEENLILGFFDLKTGIAGEILQKFSTYNLQLAIIGDFSKYSSKSLKDFIYESNKQGRIYFCSSIEEAKERLSKTLN
jgi:hypothetical protein